MVLAYVAKAYCPKLLIKEKYKVLLVNEPIGHRATFENLPLGVTLTTDVSAKPFEVIQLFVVSKKDLQTQLPKVKLLLNKNGLLWVTYPKGTAELNRDSIREYAATVGLQAIALVSVDKKSSALRLKIVQPVSLKFSCLNF